MRFFVTVCESLFPGDLLWSLGVLRVSECVCCVMGGGGVSVCVYCVIIITRSLLLAALSIPDKINSAL